LESQIWGVRDGVSARLFSYPQGRRGFPLRRSQLFVITAYAPPCTLHQQQHPHYYPPSHWRSAQTAFLPTLLSPIRDRTWKPRYVLPVVLVRESESGFEPITNLPVPSLFLIQPIPELLVPSLSLFPLGGVLSCLNPFLISPTLYTALVLTGVRRST